MRVSDFRSDTLTSPSPAMREAMSTAEVGDDVLDGDPSVRRLEARAAEWLGMEGALFVPSGTMANQVAAGAWTRPGEEVIVEREAHILRYEAGGLGALHGLQTLTLAGRGGALDPEEVERSIRPDYIHCPRTALVCVEQTHMGSGGSVLPLDNLRAVGEVAQRRGVRLHMDGARLANAVVASGRAAREHTAPVDSVSVCFSKGLGAPVGSIVAGSGEFLDRARVVRKRLGGWMRQSGVIAAPALLALETGVDRLAEDHALARSLAVVMERFEGLGCPAGPEGVQTNIVLVSVALPDMDAPGLCERLEERGVRAMALESDRLRLVTHLGVGPEDVVRLQGALEEILGQ